MGVDVRELFPDDISDETAYHLVNFFYDFALAFESIHLGKVLRYQKAMIEEHQSGPPWDNEDIADMPDPPF